MTVSPRSAESMESQTSHGISWNIVEKSWNLRKSMSHEQQISIKAKIHFFF